MHRASLVRTITHKYNSHNPLAMMTGYADGKTRLFRPAAGPARIGAICQYLGMGPRDLPGAVCLPCYPGGGGEHVPRHPATRPLRRFPGRAVRPDVQYLRATFRKKPARPYYDPVWPYGEPMMPALDAFGPGKEPRPTR
ncbi:MAG: hypothetical protein CM1200mP2_52070 [Planctomycetaceae bacterium]|nr:MAG: hypothetical protein CM1200mP2_52070 [Planctomycetaceae bacterium]